MLTKRFFACLSFVLIYYLIQFTAAVGVVNFYSDADRHLSCNGLGPIESADVYDGALLLLAIFHIVEWIKMALLLTVVVLGHVMRHLMYVYVFLFLNTIFGCIAVIVAL